MDTASHPPDDPAQCRRTLADLLRRNDELRRQAEDEHQRADAARRRIDELERVLEELDVQRLWMLRPCRCRCAPG